MSVLLLSMFVCLFNFVLCPLEGASSVTICVYVCYCNCAIVRAHLFFKSSSFVVVMESSSFLIVTFQGLLKSSLCLCK